MIPVDDDEMETVRARPPVEGEYVPLKEAAARLGMDKHTAYRLAKQGRFPGAFRVGRLWKVRRDALDGLGNGK